MAKKLSEKALRNIYGPDFKAMAAADEASLVNTDVNILEPTIGNTLPKQDVQVDLNRAAISKEDTGEGVIKGYTYDLGAKYTHNPSTGSIEIQHSPGLVIAVIRLAYPDLFDYSNTKPSHPTPPKGASPDDNSYPVRTLKIFQIQELCTACGVTFSKNNNNNIFSATFKDPYNELMHKVLPGDWVLAWMTDNTDDAQDIEVSVDANTSSNSFKSGLKFIGKINTIRKNINIGKNGEKIRNFTINAFAFTEFNESIYYDPDLQNDTTIKNFFAQIIGDPDDVNSQLFTKSVDEILEELINVFLGKGPKNTKVALNDTDSVTVSANSSFLIPSVVGSLLGKTQPSKGGGQLTYSDILYTLLGVQTYTTNSPAAPPEGGMLPGIVFDTDLANRYTTLDEMQGLFYNQITPWNNVSIWSILDSFLNKTINEMYTTLRINTDGNIMPFFVARQKPFTTNAFIKLNPSFPTTTYLSLPRWKIDPGMVLAFDVGRSDALRINVVQVISHPPMQSLDALYTSIQKEQTVLWGDYADVKRNGVRGSFEQTNCLPGDPSDQTPKTSWGQFKADQLVNGHLKYNGTITVKGIQEPIAIGDNLEFDNNIYHIEQISHRFDIGSDGIKSFITEIQLSNGVFKDASSTNELWPEINLIISNNAEENVTAGNFANTQNPIS